MGIPIEKSFTVKAPAGAVWEFLTDPRRVARCLPGAAIGEKLDEQSYAGTMTIKVGPVTASYRGKMRFERLDEAAREAEIVASAQETRGKGGADMRMKSRVVARSPEETEVTVTSDVNVVGVLAQFGRGMIQDVSDQLFERFAVAMRAELEAAAAAPAASASRPAGGAAAASASQGASASQTASAPSAAAAPPAPTAPAAGRDAPAAPAPTAARDPSGSAELAGAPPAPAAAPPPAAAPAGDVLDVGALGAAAAGRAAWRTLRRPGFWISIVLLVLLVYVAFYRH